MVGGGGGGSKKTEFLITCCGVCISDFFFLFFFNSSFLVRSFLAVFVLSYARWYIVDTQTPTYSCGREKLVNPIE